MAKGVELTWSGGEHEFKLNIDLLRALQERCDAGPQHIFNRLGTGEWMVDDITSTIRLSLEGGGLEKEEARKLVKKHVEDRPLVLSVLTARLALAHALFGDENEEEGTDQSGEVKAVVAD
ncbi:gene transfer agent family protein [Mesorhizobium retamae]|uniref:gene transfer agent family protein n=1 Tax=Mesorhizobium retamae TaxID=2912854 RepID=UPI0031BA5E77